MKYFRDASDDGELLGVIIKGIKDNKLISRPIQILSQELAEIVTKVLKNTVVIKKSLGRLLNI